MGSALAVRVVLLHGFLGQASDWSQVLQYLPKNSEIKFEALDYWKIPSLQPTVALNDWGKNFLHYLEPEIGLHAERSSACHPGKQMKDRPLSERTLLVGYSLGGRLAAQAFQAAPEKFDGLHLISSHLGLEISQSDERAKRKQHDYKWSQKFLSDPWEKLVQEWNSQEVFKGGDADLSRAESDFDRKFLAAALNNWSLSEQTLDYNFWRKQVSKVTYSYGNLDKKYVEYAENLKRQGLSFHFNEIPESSHRVWKDHPNKLAQAIALSTR